MMLPFYIIRWLVIIGLALMVVKALVNKGILSQIGGLFLESSSVFVDYDGYQDYEILFVDYDGYQDYEIYIEEIGPEAAPGKEQGQYSQYRPGVRVA